MPDTIFQVKEGDEGLYRDHVKYYFDTQMGADILNLAPEDKSRFFQMMTDYADLFEKIFHPGIPIIEHILGKLWEAANANPHEGIDWDHKCEIIEQYEEWKKTK